MFLNLIFALLNIVMFLNGFFPFRGVKQNTLDAKPIRVSNLNINEFNRTILMVIDALRFDFVNEQYMPLTSELIKKNGCLMNVEVTSPTVTLPRIKSLMTGYVPQFVDVFYNLGNPQYVHDSILHSAKKDNQTIVFYGDDTWLKVFPHMFSRQEGTTSFFVTDFYEVDNNVTRHAIIELEKEDWNFMILHYLGLDHIGHVYGPFDPLVPLKLKEMDQIFFKLFEETFRREGKSLLLLTGDHGMKDSGGHGGSTYSEMHVPLVILGQPCENGSIDQVDIVPNLAVLLNLEIPIESIGKLSRNILVNISLDQYLAALDYNFRVLNSKYNSTHLHNCNLATKLFTKFLNDGDSTVISEAIELYEICSKNVSEALIQASVSQNMPAMIVSVIFITLMLIISFDNIQVFHQVSYKFIFYVMLLSIRIFLEENIVLLLGIILLVVQSARVFRNIQYCQNYTSTDIVLMSVVFFQNLTWLSSSFIEEEQEYWYFSLNSLILFELLKHGRNQNGCKFASWILVAVFIRSAQTLNQTGDKWASLPDLTDYLLKTENYYLFVMQLSVSVLCIYFICSRNYVCLDSIHLLEIIILVMIYTVKLDAVDQILIVKLIYLSIFLYAIVFKNYVNTWIFLISLVAKPQNLCMIPLCVYVSRQIFSEHGKNISTIFAHLLLSKSFYFMQGNGNSLANVDVTVGYLGLSSFQPLLVAMQVLLNVYSFSILSHLLLLDSFSIRSGMFKLFYVERLYSITVIFCVVLIFRNHISVWTIYAPKLSIEFSHFCIFFIEVTCFSCISFMKGLIKSIRNMEKDKIILMNRNTF